jgi:hypothetical protein
VDGRCDHQSRSKALLGQYCRHHVCSRRRLACRELRPSFLNIVASMTSGLPHRRYLSHSIQHTTSEESHEIRFGIQQFQYFALIARYVRGPPLPVIYARYRAARGSFFFSIFKTPGRVGMYETQNQNKRRSHESLPPNITRFKGAIHNPIRDIVSSASRASAFPTHHPKSIVWPSQQGGQLQSYWKSTLILSPWCTLRMASANTLPISKTSSLGHAARCSC